MRPEDGDGFRISGVKHYSTGSLFADWILVSAVTPEGRRARVTVGRHDAGVDVRDDWDGFGQTLTGSGTTVLEDVPVPAQRVTLLEGGDGAVTAKTSFLQLVLLASLVGVGGRRCATASTSCAAAPGCTPRASAPPPPRTRWSSR